MGDTGLYVGTPLGGTGRVHLDPDHLTTHAVCLGMTGSGKTGLGMVVLEELARRGVPLLVVDLKGDMVDLLLTFPELDGVAFAPWVPSEEVGAVGRARAGDAVAARWRDGLAAAGLAGADVAAVRDGVRWRLVTPGVGAAAPLDILPSLAPPAAALDDDARRARADGVVGALLSLLGRGGDPLTDRDHVLVSSLLLEHWRRGEALDFAGLVRSTADPPLDTLGALPLDTFYPRDDRMKLVLAMNTLLASPAFAAWTRGTPLDMDTLLGPPGQPAATILTVAHLDERQRLFALSLVLAELLAWTRRQPASGGLRALLYIDEVQGILPPHPANPPTKGPLLTLLKQGRAFGVGAWLATQNPVDLDYKAAGNAGVQVIGRLITERDRERALDGLGLRRLPDGRDADEVVAGLGKRQFVLVDVRASERVRTFASRWAMSYLRGPIALAELDPLLAAGRDAAAAPPAASPSPTDDGATAPPVMATDVPVAFEPTAAGPTAPWLSVEAVVQVERKSLGVDRTLEERWWIPVDHDGSADWHAAERAEEEADLTDSPPAGATFPRAAPARLADTAAGAEREFVDWRSGRPVAIAANPELRLAAEPGESREAFRERCLELADRADDDRQQRVRSRFEKRMDTVRRRIERERDELDRDRAQLESRQAEEKLSMVEGLFSVLLGSRSLRSAAGKATTRVRTAATKRRMRQRAEGAVVESENEIERLTAELEELAVEMQDEIDRIALESETLADRVETVELRPPKTRIDVRSVLVVWRSR
jgi:hypothetical protein